MKNSQVKPLRTLGVAFRSLPADALEVDEVDERIEHDLVFAGLIGMIDPPRAEATGRRGARESGGDTSDHDNGRSSRNGRRYRRRTRNS